MADFIIDTRGETIQETCDNGKKQDNSFLNLLFSDFNECLKAKFGDKVTNCSSNTVKQQQSVDTGKKILTHKIKSDFNSSVDNERRLAAKKALQKSIVLDPNFEKLHAVPPMEISKKNLQKERKAEREKTKGKKWYGLPATEMTEEVKHDLEVLQMRSVLDPKHFYKKNDMKVLPKYFQIGKVMDSPVDFYSNRLSKKERKRTIVDELLADAEFSKYNKRKYKEIISEKQKTHYKAWRQAKKLKKKK